MMSSAQPASVSGQQAEIAALQSRLDGINSQAEAATNNYDGAMWRLQTARHQIVENRAAIIRNQAQFVVAQQVLTTRLREIYANPTPSPVQVLLASGNITSIVDTSNLVQHIGNEDAQVVTGITHTISALKSAKTQLQAAETNASQQVAAAASQKTRILGLLSQQQSILDHAKANLRAEIAAQKAAEARLAAQQRAAAAQHAVIPVTTGGSSTSQTQTPVAIPSGAGNAAAVAWAERELGVPYVWGGASPSGFDCSGLVSWAYAQIGISVPHYTVAIWNAFPKVPMSQLEPGDLILYYGLDHVAMYIGGGQVIQAPHTGAFVSITSMSSMGPAVGAVRP